MFSLCVVSLITEEREPGEYAVSQKHV